MKPGELSEDQMGPVRQFIAMAEERLSQLESPDEYAEQCLELLKTLSAKGLYPCTSSLFYLNAILEGSPTNGIEDDIPDAWSEDIKAALVACGMTYLADNYEKVRELSIMHEAIDTGPMESAIKNADSKDLELWLDESPSFVASLRWPDLSDWQQFRMIILDSEILNIVANRWAGQLKDWHRFFILYLEPTLIREG